MTVNSYPVLFNITPLGTTATLIYTVPTGTSLQGMALKLTNVDATTVRSATVYAVSPDVKGSGTHDGSGNAATLSDSTASFTTNQWAGYTINNVTDGSTGTVTANTSTTITATLSGGTDNDWDASDVYELYEAPLDANTVVPTMSIAPKDYTLVPLERLDAGTAIYALCSSANKVNLSAVGGKLHSV